MDGALRTATVSAASVENIVISYNAVSAIQSIIAYCNTSSTRLH